MKKKMVSYLSNKKYAIYIPVFYEYEDVPAWRKVFVGTKEECKKNMDSFPDSIQATFEENTKNRESARKEYLLLLELGRKTKANEIKEKYKL